MARRYYHDDWLTSSTAILIVLAVALIMPIGAAFLSGLGAMICGLVFEDTIRSVWKGLGVNLDQFSMFQIGAALGFAGSFIKSHASTKRD